MHRILQCTSGWRGSSFAPSVCDWEMQKTKSPCLVRRASIVVRKESVKTRVSLEDEGGPTSTNEKKAEEKHEARSRRVEKCSAAASSEMLAGWLASGYWASFPVGIFSQKKMTGARGRESRRLGCQEAGLDWLRGLRGPFCPCCLFVFCWM